MNIMLTILTTIIGILAGAIITKQYTKIKKPYWYCKSNLLFHQGVTEINGLEISYKKNKISNLSTTYFAFWNNGKETITSDMVAEKIMLCLPDNYNIHDAQVVSETNVANQFSVTLSEDKKSIEISFKYLDHKQGAVVQLFSDSTDKNDFKLNGTIMGCKEILYAPNENKLISNIIICLMFVISVSITISAFVSVFMGDKSPTWLNAFPYGLILVAFLLMFFHGRLNEIRYKMPKEFTKFFYLGNEKSRKRKNSINKPQ